MRKNILLTGATDGIGLETAKELAKLGHNLLIHGRNVEKLKNTKEILTNINNTIQIREFVADLSSIADTRKMIAEVKSVYNKIDILINNAGVYKLNDFMTKEGLETHFAVNTIAPYLLTVELLDIIDKDGRVVNLSSAAQASVNLDGMTKDLGYPDGQYYAESKLALTMWSKYLADKVGDNGPIIVSVNPKSFLGSKMVKEAYGINGSSLAFGANILVRASLSDEFKDANGKYYDNDLESFANAHPDTYNKKLVDNLVKHMDEILTRV